jgi:poly-gamma-glutamate synthesis protein (capsule biosynthesis protein)
MLEDTDFDKANREVTNRIGKNKGFFVNRPISWLIWLSFLFQPQRSAAAQADNMADLQIFGDLFIPAHVAAKTGTTAASPAIFAASQALLDSSRHNIANFEGVASAALVPLELKKYLLRMPVWIPSVLKKAGFHAVGLANNHSMDFGYTGLLDTKIGLAQAGIESFGAGENIQDAAQPIFLPIGNRIACLFSMTRTLPASFWATEQRAGSAYLDYSQTKRTIESCSKLNYFTVVIFHWGQEMIHAPKTYQVELAQLSIDAGADVVIGHHPHVLQEVTSYKGKPIFYSIGNFAFGSDTKTSPQEGMAVRISLSKQADARPHFGLVPLNVQNSLTDYIPRLFGEQESNPLDGLIPKKYCKKSFSTRFRGSYYACEFAEKITKIDKNPWQY